MILHPKIHCPGSRLLRSVSADYSLLKKGRVTAADADNHMAFFRRLMAYLRDRELVAMLDCDKLKRIGFLEPCRHTDDFGFWYHVTILNLSIEAQLFAHRRIAAEAEAEAARIAAEAEAIAEAARIAAEVKAARIATMFARDSLLPSHDLTMTSSEIFMEM